jgi:hypothetical protein
MGVQVTIDVQRKLVACTYYGEVNDADLFDVAALISSHPDFDPSFSELVDFSEVTAVAASTLAIEKSARQKSIFSLTSRHAVVAPQDHIFGLVRMFEVLAEQTKPNIMVVRTIDEAREFLGLERTG